MNPFPTNVHVTHGGGVATKEVVLPWIGQCCHGGGVMLPRNVWYCHEICTVVMEEVVLSAFKNTPLHPRSECGSGWLFWLYCHICSDFYHSCVLRYVGGLRHYTTCYSVKYVHVNM